MVKSKGWLTVTQLLSDPEVPLRTHNILRTKLEEFMEDFPDDVRSMPIGNGDKVTYQLRPDAKEKFIKHLQQKKWMSPYDIAADVDFGIANPNTARKRLIALMDKMPGKIRERNYGKTVAYELLRSAKGEFISLSQDIFRGRRGLSKNTSTEWLSTSALMRDPDVPSRQPADIGKMLQQMYKQNLLPGKIKREPIRNTYKYSVHVSAKAEFIEKAFSRSRKRGLASSDLVKDPDIPHNTPHMINKRMAAVFDKMQGKMWRVSHRGGYAYFLNPSARDEFIALAYPKKEWLFANDLARDPDVPRRTPSVINAALMEMMKDMPGKIRNDMGKRADQYCLHASAKAEFLEKAYGVKIRPHESTKEPQQDTKDKQDIFNTGRSKFVQWVTTSTANLGRFFSSSTDEYS